MPHVVPARLDQALDLLAEGGWTVVAGGTDIFPAHVDRPAPDRILDISRLSELKGISILPEGGWRIGATTRWSEIASASLPPAFDGLRAAAREVGGWQIQNAGTIGGNLCNASPAADGVPPLLTLEAEVEIAGRSGVRRLGLENFLAGVRQTALRDDEMLTAVLLPDQPASLRGGFLKLGARRYLVISIAMVAVVVATDAEGRIETARVAVGACSPVAQRLAALEADLLGRKPSAIEVRPRHLEPLSPIDDVRGDAAYRLAAVAEMIPRAIRGALGHE